MVSTIYSNDLNKFQKWLFLKGIFANLKNNELLLMIKKQEMEQNPNSQKKVILFSLSLTIQFKIQV